MAGRRVFSTNRFGMEVGHVVIRLQERCFSRAECNHSFESLHCIAHLNEDVSRVLPYLNTALGGFTYLRDPPSVTFKAHGKLITVSGDKIAVNALKDEEELDKILEWLTREINETWAARSSIEPSEENAPDRS